MIRIMNKEDKLYAENVLKHLFIGAQVDGLQFGISPATIKIHFTNFDSMLTMMGNYMSTSNRNGFYLIIHQKSTLLMRRNLTIILRRKNIREFLK